MAFFSWSRWLRSLLRPQTKPIQRPRTALRLETLESRLAPALFVWNGGGGDGKWGTGANWGGVAPAPGTPVDLSFQSAPGTTILTNDLTGLTVNSIRFSSNFTISGNAITLGENSGALPSAGQLSVNVPGVSDTLGLTLITLAGGGSPAAQQTFSIGVNDTLTISGQLAGSAGKGLLETGGGTLILSADNSAFTGPFEINGSVTQVANSFALGAATGFNDGTTVDNVTGSQLQVASAAGITVPEYLKLNGTGAAGKGALYVTQGANNVWSGPVELDSDTTVGALTGTSLNLTGVISDLGSGHNVTKEGQGTIGFAGTNTYRGTTTINNGILQVGNSQGLGTGPGGSPDGSTADDITVNNTATEQGTLQLVGPAAGNGLTIVNKLLILNGGGFGGKGALDNKQGNNTWTGNVILGSPAPDGSAVTIETDGNSPYYTLTVTGVVQDPYLAKAQLTKTGVGILDFTNSNTYRGTTWVHDGIMEAQDSQALGQVGNQGNVYVTNGSSLELAVDNIVDSITNTRNMFALANTLYLWGAGANQLGALYSQSGINTYLGPIHVAPINQFEPRNKGLTAGAAIGVAGDPNPTNNLNYFANDYSLTVTGALIGRWNLESGTITKPLLQKFGAGQLIVPGASNQYLGDWDISQGWVTIENSNSLGQTLPNKLTQSQQPTVTVDSGAALQLDDQAGTGLVLPQNFILAGTGVSHPFSEINQQGALENLGGINTITGNVVYLGQAGLGVERAFSNSSQLTVLGTQSDVGSPIYETMSSGGGSSGGSGAEDVNVIDTGSTSGTILINYNMFLPFPNFDSVSDRLDVYDGIFGQGGTLIGGTGAYVYGTGNLAINYGPGTSPFISIVLDPGSNPGGGSAWNYTMQVLPAHVTDGGLIKQGSGLLVLPGDGNYTGNVDIQAGVLLVENNTALGAAESGANVTVETGAALAFGNGTAYNNGGVISGTQVWGEHLFVNSNPNVQTITITGAQAPGGTFTLQFGTGVGAKTVVVPYTVTAGQWPSYLSTLGLIPTGVTQNGDEFTITFAAAQPLMTVVASSDPATTVYASSGMGTTTLGAPVGALAVWSSTTSPWTSTTLVQPNAYLAAQVAGSVNGNTVTANDLVPVDVEWRGPVTLNGSLAVDIGAAARLIIDGAIDDTTNPLAAPADLIAVNTGELDLDDANSYRGNTYLGTSSTAGTVGYDPDYVNEFFNGGAALPNPGGATLGTVITVGNSQGLGAAGSNVYIQPGSSLQLEGTVAVAGKTVYLNGTGLGSANDASAGSWFQQGPAPVLDGQTNGNAAVSGRMTGIAVAPNDPNTIYVSAAGGGAWKTTNGGKTWVQIFDNADMINPGSIAIPLFTGAIAIDPFNPNVIYLGTGEANNSGDSYYGTGTYMSVDGGHKWTLLLDSASSGPNTSTNPGLFTAISRIAVDSTTSFTDANGVLRSRYVYIATNDYIGGPINSKLPIDAGNPNQPPAGVWRYDMQSATWFDLTAWDTLTRSLASETKSGFKTTMANGLPGPNDDLRLAFPQGTTATRTSGGRRSPFWFGTEYSDLAYVNGVLYMSLGTPGDDEVGYQEGGSAGIFNSPTVDHDPALMNAVYRCINPETASSSTAPVGLTYPLFDNVFVNDRPVWYVGDANPAKGSPPIRTYDKGGAGEYPNDIAGLIKNGGAASGGQQVVRQGVIKFSVASNNTIYAVNTEPFDLGGNANILLDVYKGTYAADEVGNPYLVWTKVTSPPNLVGTLGQGYFDLTILSPDGTNVYIGGGDSTNGTSFIYWSRDGGTTWTDISKLNPSPQANEHAAAFDVLGNVYMGGDGGIFKFVPSQNTWVDLNNNLATVTLNSVAVNPLNPDQYFAGAQGSGVAMFSGSPGAEQWSLVHVGDGGEVAIDPTNPNIVYAVGDDFDGNFQLFRSTTGGTAGSFVSLGAFEYTTVNPLLAFGFFPFAIDPINTDRVLVGGEFGVYESDNQGAGFAYLGDPGNIVVAKLAVSTYQGVYEPDKNFPLVADLGANNYDPATIYVTDGQVVYYTKNDGKSWKQLPALPGGPTISDIEVDPRNRDKVYVTCSDAVGDGLGRVYELDYVPASKTYVWNEIGSTGGGLPDVPVYKLTIDPHTGNLYAGTDIGVYVLPANGNGQWEVLGTGLPLASVRDMTIDPNTNMLTIATYGRSAYQILLNDTTANAGALVSLTGSGQWNGPVVLTGATTLSAGGTEGGQINNFAATLNIQGVISDQTDTGTNKLTVGTTVNQGTVIFSGPNTYTDATEVADGVLVADNLTALGASALTTTVDAGTALKLQTSVDYAGTVILNGNGPQPSYNGHDTGALESVSNGVTYLGKLELNTPTVTIGVDSGSTLTLAGQVTDAGNNANLIKELTGTLILADSDPLNPDNYGGSTYVYQGALQLAGQYALPANSSTFVYDGAQLQLSGGIMVASTVTVDLSGSGINGTGALLNVDGDNTFAGTILLDATPGFSAVTYPVGTITIATGYDGDLFDPTNILNLTGSIQRATAAGTFYSGITKVGPDTLALGGANTYYGTTFINNGFISLQSTQGLGDNSNNDPLANDPIQRLTGVDPAQVGSFTLSLTVNGITKTSGAIATTGTAGVIAGLAQNALNNVVLKNLKTAGVLANSVAAVVNSASFTITNTTIVEFVLSVVFTGVPAGFVMPQLVALATNGATVIESNVADNGFDAEVAAGAGLQLDFGTATANTISGETLLLNGSGTSSLDIPMPAAGLSAATETGTTATITANNDLSAGETVTVAGLDQPGYNGAFLITAATATTFSYTALAGLVPSNPTNGVSAVATFANGALENVSGTNTWTGGVTLNSTGITSQHDAIGADSAAGTPTVLNVNGVLAGLPSAELDKVGPGTLVLNNTNTYGGTTDIQAGFLRVGNKLALGGAITDDTQTLTVSGALTGSYTLTYTDALGVDHTSGSIPVDYTNPATLTALQAALDSIVGAGNAIAQQNAAVYTVTFIGALAGRDQVEFALNSITSGSQVDIATVIDGGLGNTIVENGTTLQVAGGVHVSTEQLILNGNGVGGLGALEGLASESWDPNTTLVAPDPVAPDSSIILAADSEIGVATSGTFNITQAIIGNAALTKVGAGVLIFSDTAIGTNNSYTGLTTVDNGALWLAKNPGFLAIPHDLTIGDSIGGAESAITQVQGPAQFLPTALVTVNSDGLFDGNGQFTIIGTLVINDGTAQSGPAPGLLTIFGLNMTGGTLTTNVTGTITLGGGVTATSDSDQVATITGTGVFNSGGQVFTVNLGALSDDLDITVPIADTLSFTKTGNGRLELDADSTLTAGAPTVQQGELQVDGKVNAVVLAGGTVSGGNHITAGQVGTISGTGTINPGDNGANNPDGFLQTTPPGGTEAWTSTITFAPDLIDATNTHTSGLTSLTPGTDYDQLILNGGTLDLGGLGNATTGAVLSGIVGINVLIGDQFTIIQAVNGGTIIGRFQEKYGEQANGEGIAYVDGLKFDVDYSDPTKVVLTRVKEDITSFTITSPVLGNPAQSAYGQDAVFVATLIAELGAGTVPTYDSVTFTVDATVGNPTGIAHETVLLTISGATDIASFDPQIFDNLTIPVGVHTVTASFDGDPAFNTPTPASMTWNVVPDNSAIVLSPGSIAAVVGQNVAITATVTAAAPGGQTPLYQIPSSPGMVNNVTFIIDPNTSGQFSVLGYLDATGTATLNIPTLSLGTHHIQATYGGDGNYNSSNTGASVLVTVNKDNSTVTLVANPTSPGTVGQPVTFTAIVAAVAPGTAAPAGTDTVQFLDGTTILGSGTVGFNALNNDYEASYTTPASTLIVGTHTINAKFSGDGLINPSAATPLVYVVNPIATTTTLVSSINPSALNQVVLFTATISSAITAGAISGSVAFYEDYGLPTQRLLGSNFVTGGNIATYSLTTLPVGTDAITAVYSGATNYATSSSTALSQVVLYATTTMLTPAPNPATYGQTVNLTANVALGAGMPLSAGTPQGTVAFYLDNGATPVGTGTLDSTGAYTLPLSTLTVGTHAVQVIYTPVGGTSFQTSTSSLVTLPVESLTTTTLTASANPAGEGNPVTLTATVTATSPGANSAYGGTVTFTDVFNGNATTLAANVPVDPTTGIASITTSWPVAGVGTHAITAAYSGSLANLDAASTSSTLGEIVRYAATVTSLVSSLNPSPFGTNVGFTATLAADPNAPGSAGVPTGTVSFYGDGGLLGTANVNGTTATFTTISALPVGMHAITAVYNGNSSFAPVTSSALAQNVLNTTSVAVGSSLNPSTFGQAVTFTATVSNTAGASTPAGMVTFSDNGVPVESNVTLDSAGQATYITAALDAGNHAITVSFATNNSTGGFYASGGTLAGGQVVNAASTSTSVITSQSPTVFGQSVTFTATVTTLAPGSGTPIGATVNFLDGSSVIGSGTVNAAGQATYSTGTLSVTTHTIQAVFVATQNFTTSSGMVSQVVNKASSSTALTTSGNPSVAGQPVTFTATVSAVNPGIGTPTGTVDFYDGATPIGSGTLNGSGQTTFQTSLLAVGVAHAITAVYDGDNSFTASPSSNTVNQVVNPDATTTTLAASVNPSVVSQLVTFTATVTSNSPGSGTPTGTVNFIADGNINNPIGSGTLDGSGHVSIPYSGLTIGAHNITAVYVGDTNYTTSTSAALSQQVNVDGTTTVATTSGTPSVFSQPVTFTATVTANNPGGGPVTVGTVNFIDTSTNTLLAANVSLDNTGTAIFTTSTLPVGLHNIVASFNASSSFTGSNSLVVSQVIKADGTVTTLASSANPAAYGQSVLFTASVTAAAPGIGAANGNVTFTDMTTGQTLAANVALVAGQASFTTTTLAGGLHTVVATFAANASFNASTSNSIAETINAADTKTTVATTTNPTVYGQAASFTITVTSTGAGGGTPQGIVTVYDAGIALGTATLDATGKATFTTTATALTVGPNAITASYGATTNFNTSTSTAVNQQVNAASTLTTVGSSQGVSTYGQSVTFTATVIALSPGSGIPQGTVNFLDGATPIGSGTLNASGQATFMTGGLAVTSHAITAVYVASTNYATSTSNTLNQVVTAATTATTVSTSLTPSVLTQAVTFTAIVTSPSGGIPTGSVTFFDNGSGIGAGTLDGTGTAMLTTSTLAAGTHTITASYTATTNFGASTSAAISQKVNAVGTVVTISPSTATTDYSQPVTFTATVTAASPGSGPVTSGFVSFTDATTNTLLAAAVAVDSNGQATFTTSSLAVGTHNVVAKYLVSPGYGLSTSAPTSVTVSIDPTTTTLTSSSTPTGPGSYTSVYSEPATLTAVVDPAPGAGLPAGSVTFKSGSINLGTGTLAFIQANNDYEATVTTTAIPAGTDTVTATYNPTNKTQYQSSSASITQTVTPDTTSITITSAVNPSVVSTAVSITAQVTADAPGSGAPTGTVTFVDSLTGNTLAGPVTLSNGKYTINPRLPAPLGTHNIVVTYTPANGNFAASSNTLAQGVFYASKTTLHVAPAKSYAGDTVTFTATIGPGPGAPKGSAKPTTGSVTFFDGTTILQSGVPLTGPGQVVFAYSGLSVGTHKIKAQFDGDGTTYAVSTSAAVTETVAPVPVRIVATLVKAPTSTATAFTIRVQMFDANDNLITSSAAKAVLSEQSGAANGFTTHSVAFTGGKTNAYIFSGLKVQSGGDYVLEVTVNTPVGVLETTVQISGVIGRLH